ncbi:hypothetical protein A4X13_0g8995, partial [Tilletia indica]
MTDPAVLATQSSVDAALDEARKLLSPAALQVYVNTRSSGQTHAVALATALSEKASDAAPTVSSPSANTAASLPLASVPPATAQPSPAPSAPSQGDIDPSAKASLLPPSAPKKTARVVSGSRTLRSSTAAAQAEKRPIAQVADSNEAVRPTVRPRIASDQNASAEANTPGTAPTPSETPAPPLSATSLATPGTHVPHPSGSSTLDGRPRTPEADTEMEAFMKAFRNLSPSKQQRLIKSVAPNAVITRAAPVVDGSSSQALGTVPPTRVAPPTTVGLSAAAALGGIGLGGAVPGISAFSPPSQSATPPPVSAAAPSGPHASALTTNAFGPALGEAFPTDDALGHFSGTNMPGFPPSQSTPSATPSDSALHYTGNDPRLLLGYDPEGTVGDIVQLPCQTTMNKVAASQYVELWHFTLEGIAAGFRKSSSLSDTGRRLMDQLGTQLELPKAAIPDECMTFEMYFHASRKHVEMIRHAAAQQIDPTKKTILMNEAAIWSLAYERITARQGSWPMTAKYTALLRHYFYSCTVGLTRPNPAKWQYRLWEHVVAVRQGNLWEGSLPYEPVYGLPSNAPSVPPSAAPRPPRQPSRAQTPGNQRPFRSSSQGVPRSASGACFICGRTQTEFAHD